MATDDINQGPRQSKRKKQTKDTKDTQKTGEPQKITIELYKYKTLIDALEDPKKVFRVVFTVFFIGILLFAGITAITLAIKRLYPYSDITTNGLGATTIKSERNEVSYWLFNTSTVWANSGIAVDEGDIITIRASGKSHTAIHHLYDAASTNKEKHNDWVGSEGEPDVMANERDRIRRQFRIFPDMPSGALLMQVSENTPKDTPHDKDARPEDFYFIGKERQHIYINHKGTLHFAVNDIILNRPTIANMMWENICLKCKDKDNDSIKKTVTEFIDRKGLSGKVDLEQKLRLTATDDKSVIQIMNSIKELFEMVFKDDVKKANLRDQTLCLYSSFQNDSLTGTTNKMWEIIRSQYVADPSSDSIIDTYLQKDSLLNNKIHLDSPLNLKPSDPIARVNTIKSLFDIIVNKKVSEVKKIGKMELGYSRIGDSLVCELSYYYGNDETENSKRKNVWFDDNIGSFLIVVEKTK